MRDERTPRRRRLSPEEHKLWNGIIRTVAPLRRRPLVELAPEPAEAEPASVPAPSMHQRTDQASPRQAVGKPAKVKTAAAKSVAAKPAPPVAGLDRRDKQRLARGTQPLDGRIDLHGRTQSEAHDVLLAFLRNKQRDGGRFVLVITGKGGREAGDSSSPRGVLKRQVPLWLRLPEFRGYVLAVEDAHAAHGGAGALYVRLRRPRCG